MQKTYLFKGRDAKTNLIYPLPTPKLILESNDSSKKPTQKELPYSSISFLYDRR